METGNLTLEADPRIPSSKKNISVFSDIYVKVLARESVLDNEPASIDRHLKFPHQIQ